MSTAETQKYNPLRQAFHPYQTCPELVKKLCFELKTIHPGEAITSSTWTWRCTCRGWWISTWRHVCSHQFTGIHLLKYHWWFLNTTSYHLLHAITRQDLHIIITSKQLEKTTTVSSTDCLSSWLMHNWNHTVPDKAQVNCYCGSARYTKQVQYCWPWMCSPFIVLVSSMKWKGMFLTSPLIVFV